MIAILTVTLSGCLGNKVPDFTDLYQITQMVVPIDTSLQKGTIIVPAKFNPRTGTLTPLCTDPLCSHGQNSGCLFPDTNGMFYSKNGKVYFEKHSGDEKLLMCYDAASMSSKKVVSMTALREMIPEGVKTSVVEKTVRFGYLFVGYKEGSERRASFRVNLDDGKVEQLDAASPWAEFAVTDGYIFMEGEVWPKTGFSVSTDINGSDRRILTSGEKISAAFDSLIENDILLYLTYENSADKQSLHAYDLRSETDKILLESLGKITPAADGQYIYYVDTVENPTHVGYDANENKESYNLTGGIMWRLNPETGELSEAFSYPDYQLQADSLEKIGQYIVVNYQRIDYDSADENFDQYFGSYYDYPRERGRIVYDTETGTSTVYSEGTYTNIGNSKQGALS